MCDTKKYSTLPENADKVLFSEDFVNHILLNHGLPLLSSGIADYRASIYKAFNPQVGIAANHISNVIKDNMSQEFARILKRNLTAIRDKKDINVFRKIATSFKSRTLKVMRPIENGVQVFLTFCVKMSTFAVEFFNSGILEAPDLAVEFIISILGGFNMVDEGGWKALHLASAVHSQDFVDVNYLTPESASDSDLWSTESEWETMDDMSSTSSSGETSEASRSPDHGMNDKNNQDGHPEKLTDDFCTMCITEMCTSSEGQASSSLVCKHVEKTEASRSPDYEMNRLDNEDELPEKLSDGDFCTMCITAMSTSSEGQASSSLVCKHVEKTIDVVSENIAMSISDNTSDTVSSGSSKEKDSKASLHSFEGTSSEDETSKQRKIKKLKKKPSFLHSKDSDSDSEK